MDSVRAPAACLKEELPSPLSSRPCPRLCLARPCRRPPDSEEPGRDSEGESVVALEVLLKLGEKARVEELYEEAIKFFSKLAVGTKPVFFKICRAA